jgi:CDP-glucose 4,6-dehydratase
MPHPFADFYKGKRVFVSGHTSFAGGWLTAWLKLMGAQVCGYGLPPSTRPNFFDATLLDRGMTSIFGDRRNREVLPNAFADFQPEIVIHYAAQVSAQQAKADPVGTFATNVMGTVHILEEARQIDSVRAVLIANSDQCYENRSGQQGQREEDALGGHDFVSSTAAGAELAAAAYTGEFFRNSKTAIATARTGDVIGGGDWAEGELVPEIVRGILSSQPIVITASSAPAMWQHVLEPVRAHLLLAQKLFEHGQGFSGAWNFATDDKDAVTARKLAESFVGVWGAGELAPASEEGVSGIGPVFRLNTYKAQTQLNWRPLLPLHDAIAWTVEWFRAYYAEPASSWRTTEDQIQRYMRLPAEVATR